MRTGLLGVVVVVAGALVVIDGAPVRADVPDHEIVREYSGVNSNPSRSKTATCPSNKDLIGTGGAVSGGNGNVLLESIVPDLATDSVTVSAHESPAGTTNNWSVRAMAVCADAGSVPGRYLVEADTSDIAGSPSTAAYAECDEGDRALGVGFVLDGPDGRLHLTGVMPTEDTVLAIGEEDAAGTTTSWDVMAIALCAQLFDSQVHWGESASRSYSGTQFETTVCPTDFDVTTGGAVVVDESGAHGDLAIYYISPEEYQGSQYALQSSLETPPRTTATSTLHSYVVCADLR